MIFLLSILSVLTISAFADCESCQVKHESQLAVRRPATAKPVDLYDLQLGMSEFKELQAIFSGKDSSGTQVKAVLKSMTESSQFVDVEMFYRTGTFEAAGVADPFEWMEKNEETYGALNDYIDPQNEGEPIWATTNRALRAGTPLSKEQKKFKAAMEKAIKNLPSVRGYFFRGANLKTIDANAYKKGTTFTEKPFMSTSVSPEIAEKFAKGKGDKNRVATIFIVKANAGAPISAFHPGNNHELEVLLPPGSKFRVTNVVPYREASGQYVFLEPMQ